METERLLAPLQAVYRRLRSSLTTSLWTLPTLGIVLGVTIAMVLVRWDPRIAVLADLDGDTARTTVATIVSAVVAAISLVVTGTIVAVQLAAGQFSPRLLRDAVEDTALQSSLAVLVGTVAYGLTLLPQLGGDAPPTLAVLVATTAAMVDVGLLVLFLRKVVQRLRLEAIIRRLVDGTTAAIDRTHPLDGEPREVELPTDVARIRARRTGYVQDASLDTLARLGAEQRINIRLRPRVGTFLVAGTDVAYVWSADSDEPLDDARVEQVEREVDRRIVVGVDRTLEGDPGYGIRHLVDIACRAVSPGVNDPTTAVQCIDHATGLLVELSRRPLGDGVVERDGCVASVSRPDFADLLELAQTQVMLYGSGDPWVLEALARQLRDLLQAGPDRGHRETIAEHLDTLRARLEASALEPNERRIVEAALTQIDLDVDQPTDEGDNAAS